jgi:signal transduction histidine kinase
VLIGFGLALGITMGVEAIYLQQQGALGPAFTINVATSLPFVLGIAYGGYWLSGSELESERHGRIVGWSLGATAMFLIINLLMMSILPPGNPFATFVWIRWATSIGAGTGLLLGIFEARAIHRRVSAERARLRADQAEARRQLLDYVNGLLRHEVLNGANVIDGRASMVLQRGNLDTTDHRDLETIQRQGQRLASIIEDARVLLQATTGDAEKTTVDLVSVIETELDTLTDYDRSVTVETDLPESIPVVADALLPRVFSNLFANAAEHHDGPNPTVSVTVETTAESVLVTVADDGPGVPESERESLFECEDTDCDHGLGLSLVAMLLERYDGSIELTETGPEGSVFTVELPRADDPTGSPVVASSNESPEGGIDVAGAVPTASPD